MKKKRKRFFKLRLFFFLFTVAFLFIVVACAKNFNSKVLPVAVAMAQHGAVNKMNGVIYDAVNTVVNENHLTSDMFYTETVGSDGLVQSISVNTVLVNDICAQIAAAMSDGTSVLKYEVAKIPLGFLTGVDVLANIGPAYGIDMMPVGTLTANYDTSFQSVGINQVNFQVVLNVDCQIQILLPFDRQDMTVSRTVVLVNTVFSGQVPDSYYQNLPVTAPAK